MDNPLKTSDPSHCPELDAAITRAAQLIAGAGAGLGVDSKLGTFRGRNAGTWPPLVERKLDFSDMSNPEWFDEGNDAHLGWGFWWWRYNAYVNEARPHEGYHMMMQWAQLKKYGGFAYTSNIDGHWQEANMPANRLCEIHGSIRYMQCIHSSACTKPRDIWPANVALRVDPATHKALDPLPHCPHCNKLARPNVLMFGDVRQVSDRTRTQQRYWREWLAELYEARAKVAIIEVGAGTAIPSIRLASEQFLSPESVQLLSTSLIRINLEAAQIPSNVIASAGEQQCVSVPLGGLAALTLIDNKLKQLTASA